MGSTAEERNVDVAGMFGGMRLNEGSDYSQAANIDNAVPPHLAQLALQVLRLAGEHCQYCNAVEAKG
jgi:hypothetical protein